MAKAKKFILVCLCVSLPMALLSAEKVDQEEEAIALLNRAAELSDIRAADSPPFRLQAQLRVAEQRGTWVQGSYLLLWSSPRQWREEIMVPGYSRVRVAGKDKTWQQRDPDYEPLWAFQLMWTLAFKQQLQVLVDEKPGKVRERKRDGIPMKCVDLSIVMMEGTIQRELCFHPITHVLLREKNIGATFAYADHVAVWGNKVFPRRLQALEGKKSVVEVSVEELSADPALDPSLFEPLSGAEVRPNCERVEQSRLLRAKELRFRPNPQRLGPVGDLSVYAVIGVLWHRRSCPLWQSARVSAWSLSAEQGEARSQPRSESGSPPRA